MDKDKQNRYDNIYLNIANEISNLSYAKKKKVGALIVKDNMIISDGYNGTPSNYDNSCEDENNNTYWYVLHAEANAITKLARCSTISSKDSTLYITMSPCKECSKLIIQSEIKRVIYKEKYRDTSGIDFLKQNNIIIEQLQ
jgi:dCMP deaminase